MKFDVNKPQVIATIEGAWEKTLPKLTSVVFADMRPFVKMDTGMLDRSAETASDFAKGKIVWNTPYAHYQHENHEAKTLTYHPLATKRWTEKAENQCKNDWDKQAQKLFAEALK